MYAYTSYIRYILGIHVYMYGQPHQLHGLLDHQVMLVVNLF